MTERDPDERTNSDEALRALIIEAFGVARRQGKTNWQQMHAGPLKNRIILLRGGELEPEWESVQFTKLLRRFPGVVTVDSSRNPPVIELVGEGLAEVSATSPEATVAEAPRDATAVNSDTVDANRWRIRRDLWDSVMDVRTSDVFVWVSGAAIRVSADEAEQHQDAPRLPTLTGPDLDAWQAEFAKELAEDERDSAALEGWGTGKRPTSSLPRHLQHLWYARLKTRVRARIEEWFKQQGIPIPPDVVRIPVEPRRAPNLSSSPLRVFVERCIAAMSEDELAKLQIPASVAMRLQG